MSDKDDLKAFEEAIFADAEFWDNEELSIKEAFLKKPVKSSNIRKAIDKDKKEKPFDHVPPASRKDGLAL